MAIQHLICHLPAMLPIQQPASRQIQRVPQQSYVLPQHTISCAVTIAQKMRAQIIDIRSIFVYISDINTSLY